MHQAVCDECGNNCEVPFKPSSDKPIYCDNCFKNIRGESKKSDRRYSSDRDSKKRYRHKAICDSCGKSCEVPFKPTGGKPIYCNNCFGDKSGKNIQEISYDHSSKQFDKLNKKLDQILEMLSAAEPEKKVEAKKKPKKPKKAKKVVVKKPAAKKVSKKKPAQKKAKAKKK
jgi:CxxC-x17-CxxC domain-containing protein